eukprot:m51a1_g12249 hypothetical protein (198) ;mRNA; f:150472-151412
MDPWVFLAQIQHGGSAEAQVSAREVLALCSQLALSAGLDIYLHHLAQCITSVLDALAQVAQISRTGGFQTSRGHTREQLLETLADAIATEAAAVAVEFREPTTNGTCLQGLVQSSRQLLDWAARAMCPASEVTMDHVSVQTISVMAKLLNSVLSVTPALQPVLFQQQQAQVAPSENLWQQEVIQGLFDPASHTPLIP